MFEAIKNLKPSQRLQAFLFVAVLTSLTSVITVYLKTDDCKEIGDQYQKLVGNYTELMRINNQIIEMNNDKDRDLLALSGIMRSLNTSSADKKTTLKTTQDVAYSPEQSLSSIVFPDTTNFGDVRLAASTPQIQTVTKTVEKTTVIRDIPSEKKKLLDSAISILKKYRKSK
ncbi:hypothetical protein UFOVP449_266 [uncultured Caudovirales phage]|uniref:Uncharacterized protein n=1 Tax=uncultured Caudovirales phage TaxID=2100421 RepID=A0A6J5MJG5_9CAUD|nr:hypothetical protein UFOVP449_266 [uncultured Caudovirales phage]